MYYYFLFPGGILPSLLGPQMVTDPFKDPLVSKECVARQIHFYMLVYFVLSVTIFLMFLCHFPDNHEVEQQEQPDVNNSVISDCLKVLS